MLLPRASPSVEAGAEEVSTRVPSSPNYAPTYELASEEEVHVPMTQEEVAHVATIISQRSTQQHVEQFVEVPAPTMQAEMIHAPEMVQQKRAVQQQVEYIVDVPASMTKEEIVEVPTVANHHRHHHIEGELSGDKREPVAAPRTLLADMLELHRCGEAVICPWLFSGARREGSEW